jgi:methionine sulfoxide reductase heme-binding subunit
LKIKHDIVEDRQKLFSHSPKDPPFTKSTNLRFFIRIVCNNAVRALLFDTYFMNKTKIIYTVIALLLLIAIMPMVIGSFSEEAIRWAVRRTADISFIMLCLSFGASSLHFVFKSDFSRWLMQNRRYLGISFGISFLSHAFLILFLALRYPEPLLSDLSSTTIYTGIVAFSFTSLMTLSSNDAAVNLLGRKAWSVLHTVGGYYLLAVFTLTFLSQLENIYFWPNALAAISLILLRLNKIIKPQLNKSENKSEAA